MIPNPPKKGLTLPAPRPGETMEMYIKRLNNPNADFARERMTMHKGEASYTPPKKKR